MPHLTAEQLIQLLDLKPLPIEGGYFKQTYLSDHSSGIFYLLTPDTFSELHRLQSDEIYHFYLGEAVELVELAADGSATTTILGSDIINGEKLQHVVTANTWQGLRLKTGGNFALLGCTMAPAFDYDTYESGKREKLFETHPKHKETISKLTRN